MPENGWSAVGKAPAHALVGGAAHDVRVRALVNADLLLQVRRVDGQAEAELPVLGALVGGRPPLMGSSPTSCTWTVRVMMRSGGPAFSERPNPEQVSAGVPRIGNQ